LRKGTGNAVRHGKCTNLHINLQEVAAEVKLSILDNGVGFDLDRINELDNKGLGLSNMEGLVRSLNGMFNISSKAGNGTGIYIVIPKNRNKENMKEGTAL
jgi:NarL family two-component system sensor histidine kinase LiaS